MILVSPTKMLYIHSTSSRSSNPAALDMTELQKGDRVVMIGYQYQSVIGPVNMMGKILKLFMDINTRIPLVRVKLDSGETMEFKRSEVSHLT